MSEWQPIETAPKDGTLFLFWPNDEEHATARWEGDRFCVTCCGQTLWDATHWMPIPRSADMIAAAWHPISTAPKQEPYLDLWVTTPKGGYRIPNARWTKYVNATKHKDLAEHEGWCREDYDGVWLDIEYHDFVVTHWRFAPEGPDDAA